MENLFLSKEIQTIKNNVKDGFSIAKSLKQTVLYSPLLYQMSVIGEETGALDRMLDHVADFYDNEIGYTVERITRMIEPAIIIVMSLIVGTIAISMALPMFDIFNII